MRQSGEDILDDEELINALSSSKVTSTEISSALEEAEKTEKSINDTRMRYQPYAQRGSLLFFCVADLRQIEPMYQYSLKWFTDLFKGAMDSAERSTNINERVKLLIDFFTYSLYRNVCRSLFEKDQLLYSFLICTKLMIHQQVITQVHSRSSLSLPPSCLI